MRRREPYNPHIVHASAITVHMSRCAHAPTIVYAEQRVDFGVAPNEWSRTPTRSRYRTDTARATCLCGRHRRSRDGARPLCVGMRVIPTSFGGCTYLYTESTACSKPAASSAAEVHQ